MIDIMYVGMIFMVIMFGIGFYFGRKVQKGV